MGGDRRLTFGKYKGWKVFDLILSNPDYIKWADKNIPYFSLTKNEKDMLGIEDIKPNIKVTL